jgi:hypothetical protein
MSSLRAIRLLNSVEAGITNSAALQTILGDSGRLSEFSVLMSMRGQARRMAASSVTVDTFINCPIVLDQIFTDTDLNNPVVGQAMLKKQTAMVLVSADRNTLNIIMANPTSAGLLKASPWFDTYIKQLITNLTPALVAGDYATTQALVTDNAAMSTAFDFGGAVEVILASPTTFGFVAADFSIMTLLADSTVAVGKLVADSSSMSIVASSTNAMDAIKASSIAMPAVTGSAIAMTAVAGNAEAFTALLSSTFFAANAKNALANVAGLTPGDYADVNAMIDSADALNAIVANSKAVTILASLSSALSYLATSANLGIVLNSTIAMAILGPNVTAMSAFLGNPDAWASLFASASVKGFIVASTGLVDTIAGNADLLTYLGTIAETPLRASTVPDGVAGQFQTFVGMPAKILTLSVKEAGIAATFSTFNLSGAEFAGTAAQEDLRVSSQVPKVHVAAYAGVLWDFQGGGVTAATQPVVTYVNMA